MRVLIDFRKQPQRYRYTDSMNAALVAGLVAAGLHSDDLVGEKALPWTFGTAGKAGPDGRRTVYSVILHHLRHASPRRLRALIPTRFGWRRAMATPFI